MPVQSKFMPKKDWLSEDEIFLIAKTLCELGIEEVRLTGGEPTLRADLISIAHRLSKLPLQKISLTSNGALLKPLLNQLRNTRCHFLNISLDSLNEKKFYELARVNPATNFFTKTLESLLAAKDMGFYIKLNVVVMRGKNDDEVFDFVEFGLKHDIEIRFLELMQIGEAQNLSQGAFVSSDEVIKKIEREYSLTKAISEQDATAFSYLVNEKTRIGFIAPVSKPFCGTCSRWRLSANGFLRTCLMTSDGVHLKGKDEEGIRQACYAALNLKPRFGSSHTHDVMHAIGG